MDDSPKGRILRAAAGLFHTRGYEQTKVRDLAAAVGIQSGSLFHHFRDKEQILEQVEKDEVKFVQLQFTDLFGVVKSLTIPIQHLPDSMEFGIWFDGSSIEGFTRIQESDMFLKPDLTTYAVIPWLRSED